MNKTIKVFLKKKKKEEDMKTCEGSKGLYPFSWILSATESGHSDLAELFYPLPMFSLMGRLTPRSDPQSRYFHFFVSKGSQMFPSLIHHPYR